MDKRLKFNEPWILQRADPYVYEKDGWYYFTASVPAYDSIVLRRAKKLADLPQAEEVVIWKKHESGPMSKHIWAPELHYLEGKWYIYFAGGEEEDIWKIRPYVLECQGQDPLADAWVEKGKMQRADGDEFSFEAFSLDATVFEDAGDYYYVWAEKVGVGKQISNLYIAKMESPCKLATVQVLLTTPDYDWERVGFWVNEGPAVIHHGDKLYLTYSASDTGVAYCVGMLTATSGTDLLDPLNWRKERHPVLQSSYEKGIYGPGHNSFTKDEDGNDIMVYHARTETEIEGNPLYNPNRHAHLMQVQWDENGEFYRTEEERTKQSDTAYKASHTCPYSYFPQYTGTSDDGINANKPDGQASEFFDGLNQDVKETFEAYGVETYVEMLGTNEAPGDWYPMWSFSNNFTTDTPGGVAWNKIADVKHEQLPQVVMAKDFDAAWDTYMDAYNACHPEDFISELQTELDTRMEQAAKFK